MCIVKKNMDRNNNTSAVADDSDLSAVDQLTENTFELLCNVFNSDFRDSHRLGGTYLDFPAGTFVWYFKHSQQPTLAVIQYPEEIPKDSAKVFEDVILIRTVEDQEVHEIFVEHLLPVYSSWGILAPHAARVAMC